MHYLQFEKTEYMGFLTNIFKSKPENEINKLERIIARETTQRIKLLS